MTFYVVRIGEVQAGFRVRFPDHSFLAVRAWLRDAGCITVPRIW